ncbi:unnamed protein product [Sphagnum jensenii]|uniref:DUF7748 domain-containing protein n=1 Tax=Sphagnum jensenii TaxID=128206 RepID=A0ABP1BGE7_9BRYO
MPSTLFCNETNREIKLLKKIGAAFHPIKTLQPHTAYTLNIHSHDTFQEFLVYQDIKDQANTVGVDSDRCMNLKRVIIRGKPGEVFLHSTKRELQDLTTKLVNKTGQVVDLMEKCGDDDPYQLKELTHSMGYSTTFNDKEPEKDFCVSFKNGGGKISVSRKECINYKLIQFLPPKDVGGPILKAFTMRHQESARKSPLSNEPSHAQEASFSSTTIDNTTLPSEPSNHKEPSSSSTTSDDTNPPNTKIDGNKKGVAITWIKKKLGWKTSDI